MGFMDKAKKFADQAQSKLDDVQKQFNEQQGSQGGSNQPVVEYDQHGRAIRQDTEPPHGDPLAQPSPANTPDTAPDPVA
ncbi:MAG TPA: hypothetical protein VN238_02585, partial [Solirubrobacteraceae bacterium]|nr:hypothetical protein [Solirubrobacteraceae bacterium]